MFVELSTNMIFDELEAAHSETKSRQKNIDGSAWLFSPSLKACDWSGLRFGCSASLCSFKTKPGLSLSSTIHGGQRDTNKRMAYEWALHAAFVSDVVQGDVLEPARRRYRPRVAPGDESRLFCLITRTEAESGRRG